MAGVGAPLMMVWQACGRDEGGGGGGHGLGGAAGGAPMEGGCEGRRHGAAASV
jgi:hypothetical protein